MIRFSTIILLMLTFLTQPVAYAYQDTQHFGNSEHHHQHVEPSLDLKLDAHDHDHELDCDHCHHNHVKVWASVASVGFNLTALSMKPELILQLPENTLDSLYRPPIS